MKQKSKFGREKLTKKIAALLAKAECKGATEAEAQAAFLKAQELMIQHGIDAEAVGGNPDDNPLENTIISTSGKQVDWKIRLAAVIAENFRVRVYMDYSWNHAERRSDKLLRFIGRARDTQIAAAVYKSAVKTAEHLVAQHKEERRIMQQGLSISEGLQVRQSYLGGFVHGLGNEFYKQSKEMDFLPLLKVDPGVDLAMRDLGVKNTKRVTRARYNVDPLASMAGYSDGQGFAKSKGGNKRRGIRELRR